MMAKEYNSSPVHMDLPKSQDTETVVLTNIKASPLEGVYYMKFGDT